MAKNFANLSALLQSASRRNRGLRAGEQRTGRANAKERLRLQKSPLLCARATLEEERSDLSQARDGKGCRGSNWRQSDLRANFSSPRRPPGKKRKKLVYDGPRNQGYKHLLFLSFLPSLINAQFQAGEQPLKIVPVHRKRESTPESENDVDSTNGEHSGMPLYAAHQTSLYNPPPVINGRIPKNSYGNLDIYVPSMVPVGGTHIIHPETARAAQILGIDHAKAVTGFAFKGRHGTAVISGAVVASEYREAVQEVIDAFGDEEAREEEMRRSLKALRMWKRLLAGLKIRQRIAGYEVEGERALLDERLGELNGEDENEEEEGGGGFFPDSTVAGSVEPTFGMFQRLYGENEQVSDGGHGFLEEEMVEDEEQSFPQADRGNTQISEDHDQYSGGGFMIEDMSDSGGERLLDRDQSITGRYTPKSKGNRDVFLASNINEDAEEETLLPSAEESGIKPPPLLSKEATPDPEERRRPRRKSIENIGIVPNGNDNETIPYAANAAESTAYTPTSFPHLNLPDSELAEATMLQLLHEARKDPSPAPVARATIAPTEPSSGSEPGPHVQQPPAASPTIPILAPPQDQRASPPQSRAEKDAGRGSNSDEDAGSLLSHDPSDEDADPEWLA